MAEMTWQEMTQPDTRLAGRGVPGWALRATLTTAAVAIAGVAIGGAPSLAGHWTTVVIAAGLVAGTVFAPGTLAPLLLLAGAIVCRVAGQGPSVDVGLVLLVVLMPLVHQLAGITAALPPRAVCRWRALRPAMVRLALAVLPVELAVAVAALVA